MSFGFRFALIFVLIFICAPFLVGTRSLEPLPLPFVPTPTAVSLPLVVAEQAGAPAPFSPPPAPSTVVASINVLAELRKQPPTTRARVPADRLEDARQPRDLTLAFPAWIEGNSPTLSGILATQTQRLDVYVGRNTFDEEQIRAAGPLIEQLLRENERRFGTRLKHRVSLGFYSPRAAPIRGIRGIAYTDRERAEVFYAANESLDRAMVVVAHELAHHLEEERYGKQVQQTADTVLHEGLATWITGERWLSLSGASCWKERGRQLGAAGVPLRLLDAERYGANNAYEMWASFVDFIIDRYGWDAFDQLYASGRGRAPGSADYQGVLGVSRDDLADEWRAWLDA